MLSLEALAPTLFCTTFLLGSLHSPAMLGFLWVLQWVRLWLPSSLQVSPPPRSPYSTSFLWLTPYSSRMLLKCHSQWRFLTFPYMFHQHSGGLPGGASGKGTLLPMQETRNAVRSLSWEDPLQEDVAIHCSILAWRIPWTEEPGGVRSVG